MANVFINDDNDGDLLMNSEMIKVIEYYKGEPKIVFHLIMIKGVWIEQWSISLSVGWVVRNSFKMIASFGFGLGDGDMWVLSSYQYKTLNDTLSVKGT